MDTSFLNQVYMHIKQSTAHMVNRLIFSERESGNTIHLQVNFDVFIQKMKLIILKRVHKILELKRSSKKLMFYCFCWIDCERFNTWEIRFIFRNIPNCLKSLNPYVLEEDNYIILSYFTNVLQQFTISSKNKLNSVCVG